MKFDCIEKALKKVFYHHGGLVANHPIPFLLVPVLVSAGLAVGLFTSFSKETDPEVLYGPERTYSLRNRALIEDVYSNVGFDDMLPRHKTRVGFWGYVIITPRTGNDMLTVDKFSDVLRLHDTIMNVSVKIDDESYGYTDFCMEWKNDCHENDILVLMNYNAENVLSTQLSYPIHSYPSGEIFFLGAQLGGVSLTPDGHISNAEAMLLAYYLRYSPNDEDDDVVKGEMWENNFLHDVDNFESNEITVYRQVSRSFGLELDESSGVTYQLVATVGVIIVTFSVLAAASFDWVRSKPILASLGVLTAGFGLASCFGLFSFIGVPYANVAGSMPFLIIGIGVDDMFILISAWRQTSVYKSVEERTRECMQEAALSITITTITDILAFSIGTVSPFYSIRLMCLYAAVSVTFAYFYMVTFFAACMVLTGQREEKNRHALTLRKVLPKKDAPSKAYSIFCAGGSSDDIPADKQDGKVSDSGLMIFFRKYYAPFITHWISAVVIILFYLVYLGAAIWGFTTINEGLDFRGIGTDDSYLNEYYAVEETYFKVYGPDMSIVATEELSYWDPNVQTEIENSLARIENSEFFYNSSFTISWLKEYLGFLSNFNITNPSGDIFLQILREEFLQIPVYEQFAPDIVFDSTNSSIISSRFYVIGKKVVSSANLRDMFLEIRQLLGDSNLPLIAFHPYASWFMEQFIVIRSNTILTLALGISAMFVISLLLIPHPICSLIVTLSLVSTIIGIMGFMGIWNINVDVTSLISLVIAVGFGVDYSAHIAYAFVSSSAPTRRERVIHALYSLGAPTLQGALSTILAVSVLAGSFSHIYRTFCKTMTLVITIGAVHGLVFLPIFLMICVPTKLPCTEQRKRKDDEQDIRNNESIYANHDEVNGDISAVDNPVFADDRTRSSIRSLPVPPVDRPNSVFGSLHNQIALPGIGSSPSALHKLSLQQEPLGPAFGTISQNTWANTGPTSPTVLTVVHNPLHHKTTDGTTGRERRARFSN